MTNVVEIIPPIIEQLVDAESVAAHLGVSDRFVRKMVEARKVPFFRVYNGKRHFYRFRISEVEAALREDVHDSQGVVPAGKRLSSRAQKGA